MDKALKQKSTKIIWNFWTKSTDFPGNGDQLVKFDKNDSNVTLTRFDLCITDSFTAI